MSRYSTMLFSISGFIYPKYHTMNNISRTTRVLKIFINRSTEGKFQRIRQRWNSKHCRTGHWWIRQ